MVDSVDDLKSSRSVSGKNFQIFEMSDARTASALNKIILNSHTSRKRSVWRNRKLRKRIGSSTEYISLDYFRVTGAHDTVLKFAVFFSVALRNDDVQELETRLDEILLSMGKIHLMRS